MSGGKTYSRNDLVKICKSLPPTSAPDLLTQPRLLNQNRPKRQQKKKLRSLSFNHLNIRGLMGKLDVVQSMLVNQSASIFAITETHLGADFPDYLLAPEGFKSFRRDRSDGRKGGGVLLFIPDTMECSPFISLEFEIVAAERRIGAETLLVIAGFRPPDLGPDETRRLFDEIGDKIATTSAATTVILGDLNINTLPSSTHPQLPVLRNFIAANLLQDVVPNPTRVQTVTMADGSERTTASKIDVILVRSHLPFKGLPAEDIDGTDHRFCRAASSLKIPDPKRFIYFRRYDKVNWEKFNAAISNHARGFFATPFDPNEEFTRFVNGISALIDRFVPLKRKVARLRDQPWMTPTMKRLLDQRDRKYSRWKETNISRFHEEFRELKKKARRAITSAQAGLFSSVKDNAGKLWSVLKDLLNRKPRPADVNIGLDDLNYHFVRMGRHDGGSGGPSIPSVLERGPVASGESSDMVVAPLSSVPAFEFRSVTSLDIELLLDRMAKSKKAAGPGGIPCRLIRELRDLIKEPLTVLINRCLSLSVYPDIFKIASVTPLPKVSAPKSADDYRPISLINNVSKIFERVVQSQLVEFIKTNNILSDRQSGFRNGFSTETLLLKVTEKWRRAIDDGKVVVAAFLDLKKAFDSVNHELLLQKLRKIGIGGQAHQWFTSYLSCRQQSVVVGGRQSSVLPITTGVPQGTVLGPILFTIFIDDLLRMQCVGRKAEFECFADDTLAYSAHKNPDEAVKDLNEALGEAKQWFSVNQLRLNERKCQAIYLSMKNHIKKAMCEQ